MQEIIKPQMYKPEIAQLEPLLSQRFYVELGEELKINSQYIQSIDLPKAEIVDNKIKWADIKLRILEVSNRPTVTERIMAWLKTATMLVD